MQLGMFFRDIQVVLKTNELDSGFQKMENLSAGAKATSLQELGELIDEGKVLTRNLHRVLGQFRAELPGRESLDDDIGAIETSLEDLARRQATALHLLKWARHTIEKKLLED
jgi:hypothetical protein